MQYSDVMPENDTLFSIDYERQPNNSIDDSLIDHIGASSLVHYHKQANNPHEPYSGVTALFDGDGHKKAPKIAPRGDWLVISAVQIRLSCDSKDYRGEN